LKELDIDVMRPKKMYKKLLQLRKISGEKFYHEYNDKFINPKGRIPRACPWMNE